MALDTVFVGGGISSLYAAFKYQQRTASPSFMVLEKTTRSGGRVAWGSFAGVAVVKGAGVGRLHNPSDQLLLGLLAELGIPHTVTQRSVAYYGDAQPDAVRAGLAKLRARGVDRRETFRAFATRVLGQDEYEAFLVGAGFRDFEALDAGVALAHYHFEDTHGVQTNFAFSWRDLISGLGRRLAPHVRRRSEVVGIRRVGGLLEVRTADRRVYTAQQVCVGVTISSLRRLFPGSLVYSHIQSQPFMRIYAKLNKRLPVSGFTIVRSVLQKILSTVDACVYMIAYADNANALTLQGWGRRQLQAELQRLFRDPDIRILRSVRYFWQEGTHLYSPTTPGAIGKLIHRAQHPARDVYVVGEVVALNQGWVGSALLSTTRVVDSLAGTHHEQMNMTGGMQV